MVEIDKNTRLKVRILNILLMALLFVLISAALGYAMTYLLGVGATASEFGVLSAVFVVFTALLQPMLGKISDRSRYFDWKKQLQIIAVGVEINAILIMLVQSKWVIMLMFGLFMVGVNCLCPFVYSASFYYSRFGIDVNFGRMRALGSVSYAIASFIIGRLVASLGLTVIPYVLAFTSALFSLVVYLLPRFEEKPLGREEFEKETDKGEVIYGKDRTPFFKKYPAFLAMSIAVIMIMYMNGIASRYLTVIVQHAGGNSADLGTAKAVAAMCEVPMVFFFSKLVEKFTVSRMILFGAIGFVIRLTILFFANGMPMVLVGSVFSSISYAIMAPAVVYYADHATRKEDAVTGQTVINMVCLLAEIVANLCSGFLYDNLGYKAMIGVGIIVGIASIFVTIWAIRQEKPLPETETGVKEA